MELLWILLGLVIFSIVMSVLVIVHEGGHFLAAKKAGILCSGVLIGQKRLPIPPAIITR